MADEIKTQRLPKHQAVTLFIHLLKRILPRAADLRAKRYTPVFLPSQTATST